MTFKLVSIVKASIHLTLVWAALTALLYLAQWTPQEFALQSARFVALAAAGLVLMAASLGAVVGLLGLFLAAPRDLPRRP